jgi:hypothetical protein
VIVVLANAFTTLTGLAIDPNYSKAQTLLCQLLCVKATMGVNTLATSGVLQSSAEGIAAVLGVFWLIWLVVMIVTIAGLWKTFSKAGEPGWAAIIPIYNVYVMVKIAGRPAWWLIVILLIPLLNVIMLVIVAIDIAKAFGKGTGFGLGLAFLAFIFFPILGFGDAQYQGTPN